MQVTDPRFDLFCYGAFMSAIPRQLGRHEALDASAEALASCFARVRTGRVGVASMTKYVRAFNAVQRCLQSPATAYSQETLCAIYLIMLVQVRDNPSLLPGPSAVWWVLSCSQGWIGKDDDSLPRHGQAMAHLLSVIVHRDWRDAFSAVMLVTLSISVVRGSPRPV